MCFKVFSIAFISYVLSSCSPGMEPQQIAGSQTGQSSEQNSVSTVSYYSNYKGHIVAELEKIRAALVADGCESFVYYLGDSSLDNKHWLFDKDKQNDSSYQDDKISAPAINGYQKALKPPRMIKDVDYWVNYYLEQYNNTHSIRICSIMTSVEESTLSGRDNGLLGQDLFVQKHITENDYLIVSVGGNDVALKPSPAVQGALFNLAGDPNNPADLQVISKIFKDDTEEYIKKVIGSSRPKKTIVSMIYFPDENKNAPSWASSTLSALQYDSHPALLQGLVRSFYDNATKKISLGAAKVLPLALYEALDGKTSSDYTQRVEPSVAGGEKLAKFFVDNLTRSTD